MRHCGLVHGGDMPRQVYMIAVCLPGGGSGSRERVLETETNESFKDLVLLTFFSH